MPDPIEYNIDEVVALDPADTTSFTPEHKAFLEEHKDELTTDELAKFGFEVTPIKPEPVKEPEKKPETPAPVQGATGDAGDDDKRIEGLIDKKLTPLQDENRKLQAKVDIDGFIASNPDFAKYRASITEYKNHPHYQNVPVHELARMVAANDLMKIGARAERAAAAKANGTKQPGHSARQTGTQKDWGAASKEDFAAQRAAVLGRR